jgi:hypothetical protein
MFVEEWEAVSIKVARVVVETDAYPRRFIAYNICEEK